MPTFAIEYRYDDRDAERELARPDHRAWLRTLLDAGALVGSGPFTDGSGALLLVRATTDQEAIGILDADPFQRAGLLAGRTVREWDPVLRTWE